MSAEYVCQMEEVLELYAQPYNPAAPVVNYDELSYQMLSCVREDLYPRPGKVRRQDYEYKREGTCNVLLSFERHTGTRTAEVREQRTMVEFAAHMKHLVDDCYPNVQHIHVVLDNLNTHQPKSLYEVYPPQEARRLLNKLVFHYTPKHGSWLNMAEVEFSVLTEQCLGQRLANMAAVEAALSVWVSERNAVKASINWQFGVGEARRKLARLYPSISNC